MDTRLRDIVWKSSRNSSILKLSYSFIIFLITIILSSASSAGYFRFPLDSYQPTSYDFGEFVSGWGYHAGQDCHGTAGTPVYAIADGKVHYSGKASNYGWLITIDHASENVYSLYGHISTKWATGRVKTGDNVAKGQYIGCLADDEEDGSTKWGPHLHFAIRDRNKIGDADWSHGYSPDFPQIYRWINPTNFIRGPPPSANWQLVKQVNDGKCYLFGNGKKWWINNPDARHTAEEILFALGFKWKDLIEYPANSLNGYSAGPIIVSEGLLSLSDPDWYLFKDGYWRYVPHPSYLNCQSVQNPNEIFPIRATLLDMYKCSPDPKNCRLEPCRPIANFSAIPTSGNAPLTVNFHDLSSNNPTSWSWQFGDGGTSTAQNPTHVYNSPGVYTVELTATNSAGSNTKTYPNCITVTSPPPTTYTITATAGSGGSISPSGSVTVNNGANQTFSITPNTGYQIADVKVDNVSQGAISSYTFTNVTANHTIAATFSVKTWTITASAGSGGSISPSGSVTLNNGANQTFNITPNTGYQIADVKVDNVSQGAIASYTFTNVTANHTIAATFSVKTWTITASAGSGGSISPSGSVTVNYGANQKFTITPNTGYNIKSVIVDGVSQGPIASYTFPNVTSNHSISANFVELPKILTNLANQTIRVPKGKTATLQVKLSNQPLTDTVVSVAKVSGISEISILQGSSLTFTTTNWNIYQPVKLGATSDNNNLSGKAIIQLSSSGLSSVNVTAIKAERNVTSFLILLLD